MSREIKFEIKIEVIKTGNAWIEVLTLDELLDRNGCLYAPSIQKVVYKRQFTGIKDINGKDIYEGDILKWIATTGDYDGEEFHNTVYFLDYRYRIKGTKNNKNFHCDLNPNQIFNHKCEIIGNIHETK